MKTIKERRKKDRENYARNKERTLTRKRAYRFAHPRKLSEQQKATQNAKSRERYAKNRERIAIQRRALRIKDPKRFRGYNRKWIAANSEQWREIQRNWRERPENKKTASERSKQWAKDHSERFKAIARKFRMANREKLSKQAAAWNAAHKEYCVARNKEWLKHNPEKKKIYAERQRPKSTIYMRNRRRVDPSFRLSGNLRCRIASALKGRTKSARTAALIGCSIENLWLYLESKFQEGMTRENYGSVWEVDHILPCALFDLTKSDHQRRCFHFSNLQPLTVENNRRKHSKIFIASRANEV